MAGYTLEQLEEFARNIVKRHDSGEQDYDADSYGLAFGLIALKDRIQVLPIEKK